MKPPIVAITLCGVLLSASVFAQEATTKPKEIDIPGQFIGNWTSEVTNKPAVWDQNGTKYKTFNRAKIILDGWFLHHIEVNHISGEAGKVTKSLFLWTCDADQEEARVSFAPSDGTSSGLNRRKRYLPRTLRLNDQSRSLRRHRLSVARRVR